MKTIKNTLATILIGLILIGCGATSNEAGTRVGNPPTSSGSTEAFPQGLAITSPLETATQAANSLSLERYLTNASSQLFVTSYSIATESIDAILEGDEISDCAFDPDAFLEQSTNADCYGPEIAYRNHPDALPGDPNTSGTLPIGDVGLWNENEGTTEACAAAQLNARMFGVQKKAVTALKTLASMICVANVNGIALPENGESVDLTAEMNNMATDNGFDVSFATAILSQDEIDDDSAYSYDLNFTIAGNTEDTDLELAMTHIPLTDDNATYKGRFNYKVGNSNSQGMNCGATPGTESTDAGSVLYNLSAADSLVFRFDSGNYCSADADAITNDGVLDPTDSYNPQNPGANPDGWGNDYNVLIADFDPGTSVGSYSYSWQAGALDDKARIFNISLSQDESTELLAGSSFFGFGDSVNTNTFDGNIDGFICNWAGPNNNHDPVPYVQRQDISEDSVSGVFASVLNTLAIRYAPTRSCSYDGSRSFEYDSDANNTIDTNPALAVANDLFGLDANNDNAVDDADNNGVADKIEDLGYTEPEEPENF